MRFVLWLALFLSLAVSAAEMPARYYLLSEAGARALVEAVVPGAEWTVRAFPQTDTSPAFAGLYQFTDRATGEEYTVSAGGWTLTGYVDPRVAAADKARRAAGEALPDYEALKTRALAAVRAQVARLHPDWAVEPLDAAFSPTLKYLLRARLPGGHRLEAIVSYYDGAVRTLRLFPYLPVRDISREPQLDRAAALAKAAAFVAEHLGPGWTERSDAELLGADLGLGPATDDLGMPRLLYTFAFHADLPAPPADPGVATPRERSAYVSVDARDGTALPLLTTVNNFDLWGVRNRLMLDGLPAALFYPPVLVNGEPYLYLPYLQTRLWPGTITPTPAGFDIRVGDRTAVATDKSVIIRRGGLTLYTGPGLHRVHDDPYLPYRAVAALTGQQMRWDWTEKALRVETK